MGEIETANSSKSKIEDKITHPAVTVFLRDRGGQKARPTDQDYALGESAIANRKDYT